MPIPTYDDKKLSTSEPFQARGGRCKCAAAFGSMWDGEVDNGSLNTTSLPGVKAVIPGLDFGQEGGGVTGWCFCRDAKRQCVGGSKDVAVSRELSFQPDDRMTGGATNRSMPHPKHRSTGGSCSLAPCRSGAHGICRGCRSPARAETPAELVPR